MQLFYDVLSILTDAVEWRIGEWEPCTRSEDTGLNDNQGIRRRKITCVMVIHDGIKLEVNYYCNWITNIEIYFTLYLN